ncbi:hypothetical protein P3W24_00840 [Luteibacter sp. PPL201]|uniref:Uncharacterized protein n=1 Tax=Luteibacter sahnii TaxID=3021977 RepID=A0ABT6B5Y8_9GAMM
MLTNDDMSSTLLHLFHLSLFMLKSAALVRDQLKPLNEGVGGSFSAPTHTMNLVSESLVTTTPGST